MAFCTAGFCPVISALLNVPGEKDADSKADCHEDYYRDCRDRHKAHQLLQSGKRLNDFEFLLCKNVSGKRLSIAAQVFSKMKKYNTCKQEVDEREFVGNQSNACHSAYLESLGGEDQYSS